MNIYRIGFMILIGCISYANAADYKSQIKELEDNIAAQADAISVLTEKVNGLRQKIGLQGEKAVAASGITVAPMKPGQSDSARINDLIKTAANQTKIVNQLAEEVVLLQHEKGIRPEGTEEIGTKQ